MKIPMFPLFQSASAKTAHALLNQGNTASTQEGSLHQIGRVVKESALGVFGQQTGSIYNLQDQLAKLTPNHKLNSQEMTRFLETVRSLMPQGASQKHMAQVAKQLLSTKSGQWKALFKQIDTKYGIGFLDNHGRKVALTAGAALLGGGLYAVYSGNLPALLENHSMINKLTGTESAGQGSVGYSNLILGGALSVVGLLGLGITSAAVLRQRSSNQGDDAKSEKSAASVVSESETDSVVSESEGELPSESPATPVVLPLRKNTFTWVGDFPEGLSEEEKAECYNLSREIAYEAQMITDSNGNLIGFAPLTKEEVMKRMKWMETIFGQRPKEASQFRCGKQGAVDRPLRGQRSDSRVLVPVRSESSLPTTRSTAVTLRWQGVGGTRQETTFSLSPDVLKQIRGVLASLYRVNSGDSRSNSMSINPLTDRRVNALVLTTEGNSSACTISNISMDVLTELLNILLKQVGKEPQLLTTGDSRVEELPDEPTTTALPSAPLPIGEGSSSVIEQPRFSVQGNNRGSASVATTTIPRPLSRKQQAKVMEQDPTLQALRATMLGKFQTKSRRRW